MFPPNLVEACTKQVTLSPFLVLQLHKMLYSLTVPPQYVPLFAQVLI